VSPPVAVLAAVSTPALLTCVVLAAVLGVAIGLLAAAFVGRRRRSRPAVPAGPTVAGPAAAPARGWATALEVDDLPGFLDSPPGTPGSAGPDPAADAQPSSAGTSTGATAAVRNDPGGGGSAAPSARSSVVAMTVAAAVLVALAVAISVISGTAAGGTSAAAESSAAPSTTAASAPPGREAPPTVPADAPPPVAPSPAPPTAAETPAAALALSSVPLGSHGLTASVAFGGVVLEQRAVGLTVTYPSLSVSTDGARALAHVRLPTFNCLAGEPPEDPLAAGCVRSLTEYADLPTPQLRVDRNGDRLDVAGLFPTYTRPNGSAPAYTGRAYRLDATVSPAGAVDGSRATATGTLRIGMDSAGTTPEPGVNVVEFPG
jgi:hypothetical protein